MKRKDRAGAICSQCLRAINEELVAVATRNGDELRHSCGRVLVRAK